MFAPSIEVQNMHYGHLLALAAAAIPAAADGGPIHRFALPNGTPTCGTAIARDRTIVGNDPTASATASPAPFEYRHKVFTMPSPAVPAGDLTFTGINASHVVVVDDYFTSGPMAASTESFTYSQGVTTPITFAGATDIQAVGINDAGVIVGSYQSQNSGETIGFRDQAGQITPLQDGSGETLPSAIDQTGKIIVGDVLQSDGTFAAWTYRDGSFTALVMPGAAGTFAAGVNSAGKVSGTFVTRATFISHGFLWQNGVFTTFDIPGAASTQLGGLNEAGVVTGCSTDAQGVTTGFFTKP
jgi:uncharacterized membrane protein